MPKEEKRDMLVPFGTDWYRTENVDLKKIKGEWVFYYSGKVTPYEVGFDTYRDFRKLSVPVQYRTPDVKEYQVHNSLTALLSQTRSVPNPPPPPLDGLYWLVGSRDYWIRMGWDGERPRPGDDVLKFFRKWGPLGFYYRGASHFLYDDIAQRLDSGPAFEVEISSRVDEWVPLEDYWMKYHTRKLRIGKTRTAFPEHDEVFSGYYEGWGDVHLTLQGTQIWCFEEDQGEDLDLLNGQISLTSLRPYIVPRSDEKGDKKYRLTFSFSNLCDALVGLLAQNVIGEVDMRVCKTCRDPFDAIETRRQVFCSNRCMVEYPDKQKREDPIIKYRRMLQRRLERRRGLSDKKVTAINDELLAAKSVGSLQAVEKKYTDALAKKK